MTIRRWFVGGSYLFLAACSGSKSSDNPEPASGEDSGADAAAPAGDGGSVTLPDGAVALADGAVALPDGAVALPETPLKLKGASGCSLDAECDPGKFCFLSACALQCDADEQCSSGVCDERGRCKSERVLKASGSVDDSAATDRLAGVTLTGRPDETVYVDAGQKTIELHVQTSKPVLAQGGLAYRVDSSAEPDNAEIVRVSKNEVDHVITLATGKADPAGASPTVEYAYVTTSAGAFPVTLVPRRAVEGTYAGEVEVRGLGASVPLAFGIVTEPPGVTLEEATTSYLVLNAGAADVFGPVALADAAPANEDDTSLRAVAAPLEFEPILERWVARFENGFALKADEAFGDLPAGQVRRQIAIEFSVENDGRLAGALTDTWDGLYNQAAADHTETVGVVQVGGAFVATRNGAPPDAALVSEQLDVAVPSDPQVLEYESGEDCTAVLLAEPDCADTTTLDGASLCAAALAANVVGGNNLAALMAALLSGESTEGTPAEGRTFTQVLEECASGEEPACQPSPDALCAIDAQVAAFRLSPSAPSPETDARWKEFSDLLLQITGGPQLAAFYEDVQARRTWLTRGQFEDTPVTANVLKGLNEQLMDDWVKNVVDANTEALRAYLKAASFVFLSRAVDSPASTDQRDRLLISLVTAWNTAAGSLSLAADRWSELYRLDSERAEKAADVSSRIRELYLSAVVIIQLHQNADKAAQSASIASGLGALLARRERLAQSFDALLFGRDGEVVVSTSVNPEDKSNGVLDKRREAASKAVSQAAEKVEEILADLLDDDIDDVTVRSRLEKTIWDSEGNMVDLCGQPLGCDVLSDPVLPDCEAPFEPGLCGFQVDKGPLEGRVQAHLAKAQKSLEDIAAARAEFNACLENNPDEPGSCSPPKLTDEFSEQTSAPSQAGLAIADYRAAVEDYLGAVSERAAFNSATRALYDSTAAFAVNIERWKSDREALQADIAVEVAQISALSDKALADRLANIQDAEVDSNALIAKRLENVKNWNQTRINGAKADVGLLVAAGVSRTAADTLDRAADFTRQLADVATEGLPKVIGLAVDVSFPVRMALGLAAFGVQTGLRAASAAANVVADGLDIARESSDLIREAELENLMASAEANEMSVQLGLDIVELKDELAFRNKEIAKDRADALIDKLERAQAFGEAFDRDTVELQDRRDALLDRIVEGIGHDREVTQAQLSMEKALQDYLQIVETARQERSALVGYRAHFAEFNNLVGGAQVFMTTAARLAEADRELGRAKGKLNDWLVALEYFAVRPFFDERMAILLAKSSYELKKIEDHLADLESACGGEVSTQTTNVSLRNDLLGFKDSVVDAVTGTTLSPADRLRETLARGLVPVNQRVRYSASDSVGALLQDRDVLSASFTLSLNDFANLALTCSARIASISLRLVGDDLGGGQPVATVLYDGSSQLYSCQPGIADYVDTFGQGSTTFGEVTAFQVTGRSASPVAGIDEMGDPNNSLAGLPLASRYTILIDPSLPANQDVDWSKLEDIEIGLTYSYQDPFPADSVCGESN